ncbi:MAG: carbohydrate kinase family protein [Treponema sp.]|jgi:sugar/nucleoside kinase (ribokinase family)|nr:carbohydrate kinase family protein [Treponema sp.]
MIIHGTGCCLIDFLYAPVDFTSPSFNAARSRAKGDRGLSPGRLVFAEDLEAYIAQPYVRVLTEISGGIPAVSYNLGGPSVVSLAHVAQMFQGQSHRVRFFGSRGSDETGYLLEQALARLPFDGSQLLVKEGLTARTDVLSDPQYDGGHGERTFIHLPGIASLVYPEELDAPFFDAHIIAFGGTALLPPLHEGLTELLKKARKNDAVTVVNLVYDYRSEREFPGQKWKLGLLDDAYPAIDVLIADRDEATKTAGCPTIEAAAAWFLAQGTGAVILTQGAQPVWFAAGKGIFAPQELSSLPVCAGINQARSRRSELRGDTTGCGDNFAGGILAAIAEQMASAPRGTLDLREACIPAIVAGGFACFTLGGVFYESWPGEKREYLAPYMEGYRKQLG